MGVDDHLQGVVLNEWTEAIRKPAWVVIVDLQDDGATYT
jgi:hypothetical protein